MMSVIETLLPIFLKSLVCSTHDSRFADGLSEHPAPLALIAFMSDPRRERQIAYKLGAKLAFLFDALFREIANTKEDMVHLKSLYRQLLKQMVNKTKGD